MIKACFIYEICFPSSIIKIFHAVRIQKFTDFGMNVIHFVGHLSKSENIVEKSWCGVFLVLILSWVGWTIKIQFAPVLDIFWNQVNTAVLEHRSLRAIQKNANKNGILEVF